MKGENNVLKKSVIGKTIFDLNSDSLNLIIICLSLGGKGRKSYLCNRVIMI